MSEEGVTSTIRMVRDPGFRKGEGAGGLLGLTGLESSIYPGSGPFGKVKPPTPACLVLISARSLQITMVIAQIGSDARVSRVLRVPSTAPSRPLYRGSGLRRSYKIETLSESVSTSCRTSQNLSFWTSSCTRSHVDGFSL